ncbi:MKRN2 opposite strand protein [Lingula anatina]|uniref:MKRN2 opposite strand protein n=1 Tax=Lingula anatina TaxID=7574 RepID=A0A1S3IL32_LINAN|nr:MKRN2 opposite strand protein [Lingula anatina]|eukprot:XP_013398927.2 MKRN2 opposite strand protein [Lingula anatina]
MEEDHPIFCFQHCSRDENILCLSLPNHCPLCSRDLQTTQMLIPPFRLTYPFQCAIKSPCSVVIRPTHGSFLRDYTNSSNLHVGITNTKGSVYDYDEGGLHVHSPTWTSTETLTIPVIQTNDTMWSHTWNIRLEQWAMQQQWTADRYNDTHHNCYDFVLGFLQYMGLDKCLPCASNRTEFCAKMIVPKTTAAAKYISLYRKLYKDKVVIQTAAP